MLKFILTLFSCLVCVWSVQAATSPVEAHGQLSVVNGRIVDASGTPVALAGNSLFWSNDGWGGEAFYTKGVVEYLKNDWNSSVIRAAMGVDEAGGYLSAPASNLAKVRTVIDAAIELGLYVIVDWHSHHAELYQSDAVSFFTTIANEYGEYPNLIYEIYNEPLAVSWSSVIKPYAETVIQAIRAVDTQNVIVVGTPNWSQDVDAAAADPINADHIAYTIHFYAGTHRDGLRAKAQTALDSGIALFCTEWGAVSADGDGAVDATETQKWMDFLQENAISHCNWAVNNKAEGASAFRSGTSASGTITDADLTTSGALVKGILETWGVDYEAEVPWVRQYVEASSGDLTIELEEIENWNGGFNGNLTITNNGAAVSNYTVGFTAPWSVTNFWNLDAQSWSNTGGEYSVAVIDHDWLSDIPAGGSVTMGFTANGAFSDPTALLWNGQPLAELSESEATSYTEWQATHAVATPELDDDGDGYSNLAEFLMGTAPKDATSVPQLRSRIENGNLVTEFAVNPQALNVECRLQVSTDLVEWTTVAGEMGMSMTSATEGADALMLLEWTSNSAVEVLGQRYFTRVEVREVE